MSYLSLALRAIENPPPQWNHASRVEFTNLALNNVYEQRDTDRDAIANMHMLKNCATFAKATDARAATFAIAAYEKTSE